MASADDPEPGSELSLLKQFNPRPTSSSDPLKVLGHGLPLNYVYRFNMEDSMWSSSVHWTGVPLTIRERRMIEMMAAITDKPDWHLKVKDQAIIKKWRDELRRQEEAFQASFEPAEEYGLHKFTEAMLDFCIEELTYHATRFAEIGFVPAIDATAAVYKSDTIIPERLQHGLREAVKPLENVPEESKDWHPGSKGLVLDLVHPSLCPLLYGRSKVLTQETLQLESCVEHMGKGKVVAVPEKDEVCEDHDLAIGSYVFQSSHQPLFSSRFQWLPCQVDFEGESDVKIKSYINNLHPVHHRELYRAIEQIVAKVVPMWSATLFSLQRPTNELKPKDRTHRYGGPAQFGRFWVDPSNYSENKFDQETGFEDDPDPDDEDAEQERRDTAMLEWYTTQLAQLEPVTWQEYHVSRFLSAGYGLDPIDLRRDYAAHGLQIIVKLANIHLKPGDRYEGGSWHIEGQLNERICASALYYYDSHNITESSLAFRERLETSRLEEMPGQDRYQWCEKLFNIRQHEEAVQDLGAVKTPEGRVLTFINGLQHQVQPFELRDPSQPGHRKLLALFLVNPNVRIPSTANVPPQQKDWIKSEVLGSGRVNALPPELAENIFEKVEGLIDRAEAEKLREELIQERGVIDNNVTQTKVQSFGFCEH